MSLTKEQIEKILPPNQPWIHVFIYPGGKEGVQMPRSWVHEMNELHGLQIAGEEAKRINHGLYFRDTEKEYFIENRRTP